MWLLRKPDPDNEEDVQLAFVLALLMLAAFEVWSIAFPAYGQPWAIFR